MNISDIGNNILSWVQEKGAFLVELLPRSPFRRAMRLIGDIPYIDELNWFLPIQEAVMILMMWGTAIGVYYAYMIVLRWIKAIE